MNNKGFAISSILYGVLLLFLMVLLSLLYILVTRLNRLTTLVEEVSSDIENIEEVIINEDIDDSNYYITKYRAKYEMTINYNICSSYLPKNVLLKLKDNKIYYLVADENNELNIYNTNDLIELPLIGCENNNINNFKIDKIYTSIKTSDT